MIRSLKGTATRQFEATGKSKFSGLDEELARQRLQELNAARSLEVLSRLRSTGLHKLKGDRKEYWAINVNGPWRIVFRFRNGNAYDVESWITIEGDRNVPLERCLRSASRRLSFGPVHPGRTLADELKARDLTAHALALKLRVPANRITEIVQGKRGISAETALRLGRYFGTGAAFGSLSKANTIWKRRSAIWGRRSRRKWKKRPDEIAIAESPLHADGM